MRTVAVFFLASILLSPIHAKVGPLAPKPDWARLDPYQETITRDDFQRLLETLYAPRGAAEGWITVGPDSASIQTGSGRPPYVLRFAPDQASRKPAPAYWTPRARLSAAPAGKPLDGVHIAIDPGHLGGDWAKLEERWFRIGDSKPVIEGDMTLKVAKMLVPRLEALGARVSLTRSKPGPVTSRRPAQLVKEAAASLAQKGERVTKEAVRKESERLFYRASEIRRRAQLVNESFRPDLVLCLHFNAEPWGNERAPRLVPENHLHFLITGSWSADELAFEDQRLDMLVKLLNGSFTEELAVTKDIARSMAKATGLPPYVYEGNSAVKVGESPYIWARNLLANRLFTCPVVYLEPYVMNSRTVFARVQAGDYEGLRKVAGAMRPSIYREYVDGVVAGLVDYYSHRSP